MNYPERGEQRKDDDYPEENGIYNAADRLRMLQRNGRADSKTASMASLMKHWLERVAIEIEKQAAGLWKKIENQALAT